jgi:hypothetical protein
VSPLTTHEFEVVVQEAESGVDRTTYVTGAPPVEPDVHDTVIEDSEATVPVTPVGVPGTRAGTTTTFEVAVFVALANWVTVNE